MMSSHYPVAYFMFYLVPASLLILFNFTVFVMVTRVLFAPRMTESTKCSIKQSKLSHDYELNLVDSLFTLHLSQIE